MADTVKITIHLEETNETVSIDVPKGSNLLEECKKRHIEMEWGCASAECGQCSVKILQGEEHVNEPSVEEIDFLLFRIDDGVRLACQVECNGDLEVDHPARD
ncbi:(2Fe-2S)-binding protein [Tumebacillus sp. ITR2]|jgi:ferredoxin|uniref:(2Fe-2S)-binding protein n=1 Tax=Tumebacillus amylolyticus TaxID=2801339 RepID=A0ABS1JAF5_9BACL|nr:2Fe-2S iron-sulfur cluster-binding protein [Tumebacillus amylolyticus]MBL0387265.1 (2Fe-2S)-binding protein [Tumebacillus amylolyticus]